VYKGERTKEALLAFVDAVSAPAVVDVDAASFKAAAAKQPVTFVHCGPRSGASFVSEGFGLQLQLWSSASL
jgi:hypothetical protein